MVTTFPLVENVTKNGSGRREEFFMCKGRKKQTNKQANKNKVERDIADFFSKQFLRLVEVILISSKKVVSSLSETTSELKSCVVLTLNLYHVPFLTQIWNYLLLLYKVQIYRCPGKIS